VNEELLNSFILQPEKSVNIQKYLLIENIKNLIHGKTELIHISVGELWDKYSILLIKRDKSKDQEKLKNVNTEIELLDKNMSKYNFVNDEMFTELKSINTQLWNIEDNIRIKESKKDFDDKFIDLARSVYIINDKRAECKSKINSFYNSKIHEVKDYVNY
jgi:dolichyl-phosphate-mannose--protein O-mannosyl transferase